MLFRGQTEIDWYLLQIRKNCALKAMSRCVSISFWQVRLSGWFRTIGRISQGSHNNTGWCTNVIAPHNRRPLWFFLFACCGIFLGWTLIHVCGSELWDRLVLCDSGDLTPCYTKTGKILSSRRHFQGHFGVTDILKVRLTPVNEPNYCSRFHF